MSISPAQATYVGCFYEETHSPDLDGEPPLSITRAEACFTHCSIGTWTFAAIRNGTICTCGDSEQRKYGSAPESACSTKCPENQSAFDDCGGPTANSVYNVGAMTPTKAPWPTPSVVNPTAILPSITPPVDDDNRTNNGGTVLDTKHSSTTALIASVAAVAGVAVLAIAMLLVHRRKKGRRSMSSMEDGSQFGHGHHHHKHNHYYHDKDGGGGNAVDPYTRARTGHSWFVMGHRDLADFDGNNMDSNSDGEDGGGDDSGQRKEYLSQSKKEQQDLFEGFESSALEEDHPSTMTTITTPRSIHPSEHRSHTTETAPNATPVADGPIHQENLVTMTITTTTASDPSSLPSPFPLGPPNKTPFANKVGLKMGHLKVKVPTPEGSLSNHPSTPLHSPVSPISPISPISPTSRSSSASSTTAPAFNNHSTTGYLDIEGSSPSQYAERSPTSATPSFSLASAPVPGPASNLQEANNKKPPHPREIINTTPTFSSKHHQHNDPQSPISPQKPSVLPSPTSPRSKHHHHNQHSLRSQSSSRHQKKQHRSDLIKDLILQGDSALEDKELALMAQYQPHHCWQQQHYQQHVTQAAAAAAIDSPVVPRRASLEPKEKPSSDTKSSADSVAQPQPLHLAADGGSRLSPSSAPVKQQRPLLIPSPNDYLAPPPRILVHKAM
ncbi:hypothetical protein BGX33_001304 [Mortierella sp. NVP41]|nr:hypothetical protein BGX33_001304 [Mortierella sp. NVP41]